MVVIVVVVVVAAAAVEFGYSALALDRSETHDPKFVSESNIIILFQ